MIRFRVIRSFYFLAILLVILRLGYWQIFRSEELTARAEGQRSSVKEVIASRGEVFFSDNSLLASTQPSFLVFVQPKAIASNKKVIENGLKVYKQEFAQKVAKVFWEEESQEEITDPAVRKEQLLKLEQSISDAIFKDLYWVSLGKKVNIETKSKLEKLNLVGLGFEPTFSRFYPEGSSSAHLLGFVGADIYGNNKGYFGLEGFYDGELRGRKGMLVQEEDALGLPILIGQFNLREAREGKKLILNIDRTVQHIVEQKLSEGMIKYGAKGGSVVVMEPQSGKILAMASSPAYDPSSVTNFPKEYYKNPIIADGYEPGSTFKVLVMAAGLNESVIEEDTTCDICSGPISLGGFNIRTWNNRYYPNSSMAEVIVHSDNTGMVFIAKRLGFDKLYSYIKKFGFGQITGIDLQDEQSPDLRTEKEWKEIDLATASFGQGISVTALQLVRAVSAIANGGKIMEPQVVSTIIDNGSIYKISPRVINQPISEETARLVTEMMVRAVDEGEAKFAKPKGYKVAGKTGTAQIPIAGHYDPNKTIASFIGFAPADQPKFVMLVRFTEPSSSIYGAETAAPTFFAIAKELFTYFNIAPSE